MIRHEVDTNSKLVTTRVEGELTEGDLHNDAKFWSRDILTGYACLFLCGSADMSGLTMQFIREMADVYARTSTRASVQALVVSSDEQRRAVEAFAQRTVQAGWSGGEFQTFDNEKDAMNWMVANHSGRS